jgi:chromosome segregation ATPase
VTSRAARLPAADGPIGHLRHSWAAIKLLRTWRAEYQALDDALREAVVQRDQRLAELGEAGYAAREQLDGEVAEFARTLDELAVEVEAVDAKLQAAQDAHDAAEQARRHGRLEHEKAVSAARDALQGPARHLAELVAQEETYQRTSSKRAAQTEALRDQLADLEDIAETAAERERLRSRLETLQADAQQAKDLYAALRADLKPARAAVEAQQAQVDAALNTQREALLTLDAAVEKAQAAVRAQENARATQLARRKAVTIDLARAILQLSPLDVPERAPAEAAVQAITTLRTDRARLDAERDAFDGGALRRTAWSIGGVLLLLVVLWIAL